MLVLTIYYGVYAEFIVDDDMIMILTMSNNDNNDVIDKDDDNIMNIEIGTRNS